MNRRHFIGSALCFAAGGWRLVAAEDLALGAATLKLGVLSDIHFPQTPDHVPATPQEQIVFGNADYFRKALEWYRDAGVDGVVIAGDMADLGLVCELEWVGKVWNEVFPGDRLPNGNRVEKLFVYGNHDIEGGKWEWTRKTFPEEPRICDDIAGAWEKAFGEKYEPFWTKTVKGYAFVGAHWDADNGVGSEKFFAPPTKTGLRDYLAKTLPAIDTDKPFFYIQHPHLKNTCYGPWAWGFDYGIATEALSGYPNAIAFSGHSHYPLTDERSVWQGAFTSIGTASLYMIDLPEGRENGTPDWFPSQMKQLSVPIRQAALYTVHADKTIVVDRRELTTMEKLGPDWVIPVGGDRYAFDKAAARTKPPEFAPDAKITVSEVFDGENRRGEKTRQFRATWPVALMSERASRPFDYEITAEIDAADFRRTLAKKRVFAPNFWRPEKFDRGEVECLFAADELVDRWPVSFSVRAFDCYGKASDPIELKDVLLKK